MEYNFDPRKEYTPLPDEYLQNGGRPEHNNPKKKSKLKKMLYMFMAYVVIIMAVNASDIPSRIDAAVTPPGNTDVVSDSDTIKTGTDNSGSDSTATPTDDTSTTSTPSYPLEGGVLQYTVYNETETYNFGQADPITETILDKGEIPVEQFLSGYEYIIPDYEQPVFVGVQYDFVFLGWAAKYDNGTNSYPRFHLMNQKITADDVMQIKPDSDGIRKIEIHAAWRTGTSNGTPNIMVLDANGGTVDGSATVQYDTVTPKFSGGIIYLCAYPVPVREGYRFTGWYNNADSEGKPVENLLSMNFYETGNGDRNWSSPNIITLYAGWEKVQ